MKGQQSKKNYSPSCQAISRSYTDPLHGFNSFTGNTDLVITCDGEMLKMVATQINMKLSATHNSNMGQSTSGQTMMGKDDFFFMKYFYKIIWNGFFHTKVLYIIEVCHHLNQYHNSWATLGSVSVNQVLFFHYHHGAKTGGNIPPGVRQIPSLAQYWWTEFKRWCQRKWKGQRAVKVPDQMLQTSFKDVF